MCCSPFYRNIYSSSCSKLTKYTKKKWNKISKTQCKSYAKGLFLICFCIAFIWFFCFTFLQSVCVLFTLTHSPPYKFIFLFSFFYAAFIFSLSPHTPNHPILMCIAFNGVTFYSSPTSPHWRSHRWYCFVFLVVSF